MKKYLFIALASLFAFASCSKESNETPEMNDDKTVNLAFTSKRPQLKSESKTAWNGSTIIWSTGDKIRMAYTLNGHWMNKDATPDDPRFYASKAVTIDESDPTIGTFVVEEKLTDPGAGSYVFYGYCPRTANDNTQQPSAPEVSLTIPTSQTPGANTFDGSGDIMIGKSATLNLSALPSASDPVEITWSRLVAHADLTIKNLAFVGTETVSSITLKANDDAKLTGTFTADFSDGTITSGTSNELKINGVNLSTSNNSVEVWCCVLPVTITSLNVEVVTNKAKYTRAITGISKTFKQNARNKLAINMASAEREEQTSEWIKTNLSNITSSDIFVIVGNNGSNFALANDKGTSSAPTAVAVSVSGNKLSGEPLDNIKWKLSGNATDGYTFYPFNSTTTWLYCTGTNNGVRVGTNPAKTFIIQDDYLYHVGTDRYIGIYNSSDWRCYETINNNIKSQSFNFYVKKSDGGDTPSEYDFTTVAGLNEKASNTEAEYTGTLTNAVISFVPDTKNAVIKDATGSILVYVTDHGLVQGQTYSGEVTATVKLYNSCAEITALDANFTGSGSVVDPQTLTLSQLDGNLSTYQNAYVKIEDLEVTNVNGQTISVKNGTYTYVVYVPSGVSLVIGDVMDVVGTVAHHNNNDQIKVWSEDDINVTYHPSGEVTSYTLNGTLTGGTSYYDTESEISQNSINWKVTGNTTMNPWRIGGKSLNGVDRVLYSETPMNFNVGKIVITHGAASGITVNSMRVIVASDESFNNVVSTLTPTFVANGSVTITRPSGKTWENCYYKIIYNVTVSGTTNKFIQFSQAEFSKN